MLKRKKKEKKVSYINLYRTYYVQFDFNFMSFFTLSFQTGDLLRYKISHRPDRQQLVQQHILEGMA